MNRFAKIGATALRIYTCHLLVFAIGVAVGGFMGLKIAYTTFRAMLQSQGVL
jgi:hypothetical protein